MFAKDELRRRKNNEVFPQYFDDSTTRMTVKFRSEYAPYRDEDAKVVEEDREMEQMERRHMERKKRERSTAMVEYVERKKLKEKQESAVPKTQAQALALRRKMQNTVQKPSWHPHWKLMRVVSGHLGWVRCIDVEPGNEWFCTGSGDRTIKIWDLASGTLKLTLTGHIHTVRALKVSPRHPYLFSAGEDKQVMCGISSPIV